MAKISSTVRKLLLILFVISGVHHWSSTLEAVVILIHFLCYSSQITQSVLLCMDISMLLMWDIMLALARICFTQLSSVICKFTFPPEINTAIYTIHILYQDKQSSTIFTRKHKRANMCSLVSFTLSNLCRYDLFSPSAIVNINANIQTWNYNQFLFHEWILFLTCSDRDSLKPVKEKHRHNNNNKASLME